MQKNKLTAVFTFLLLIGTIACSLLSGIFILPAVVLFTALCVVKPSFILALAPLASICLSVLVNYSQGFDAVISSCTLSVIYVLPSVLIAMGYLKKQSKFSVVINGAIGIFIYTCAAVIVVFMLGYGEFNKQILNTALDARLEDFIEIMHSRISTLQAGNFSVTRETLEQIFYLSKPLLPAYIAMISVVVSYAAVCCTNVLLKKMKIIENRNYRVMPHWLFGVLFVLCMMFTTLGGFESFLSVVSASAMMIFLPVFLIVGAGFVFDSLLRIFKNKAVAVITFLLLIIFSLAGTIIYNLFYLTGAYYSIITGIRNAKFTRHKGGE